MLNPMKCIIIDCEEEAANGFVACNSMHGMMFRIIRSVLMSITSPKLDSHMKNQWNWYISNELPTVEDAIHYSKFIR